MQRPLGAQISHMLKSRGVQTIFGIPGVHNQEMYRGIEEAGIKHVLARHEQGAGFMADGYARASGKPGVAYVITGPGLCNAMTALGQAYSDSVPVLVISSCLAHTAQTRGQLHQMLDQEAAGAAVCDWSLEAESAQAAYGLIDRAISEFQFGRARPKHIQVPIPLLEAYAPEWPAKPILAGQAQPDFDRMLRPILQAQRPLFIFGGGARGASRQARQLMTKLGAASFTTYAGRGILGLRDPLCFGSMLARPDSVEEIAKADLVVAIGTELSEVDLWRDTLGHEAAFLRIDCDPAEMSRGPDGMRLICDAGAALDRLLELAQDQKPLQSWSPAEIAATRAKWRAAIDLERPGILPVADALQAALPANTMIYSDMTQFAYAAKEVWDLPEPGLWHHPYGFGTLGYALPAAIGGAVARRGLPTLAIAGDYGFQYTVQELGAAVELALPLPILIWDNGKLGEIEDSMVRAQIAPNAVIQRNPDFLKLAEAYGAAAVAPQTLQDLQTAVVQALTADGPTVIRVTPQISSSN